jgi:hypothetical protein
LSYKCPDGSCRNKLSDCPTAVSCPAGMVKCEQGGCRSKVDDCGKFSCPDGLVKCSQGGCKIKLEDCDKTTPKCSGARTKCPDGSCRENLGLCGTQKTCPAAAGLMCPNGQCVSSLSQCSPVWECEMFTCPDGTCVEQEHHCPTTPSCSRNTPVLCPDGSCVTSADQCQVSTFSCPYYTCRDGTCVNHPTNCPTHVQCPKHRPVRCQDGSCKAGASLCVSGGELTCPTTTPYRCPSGDCVKQSHHCPTEATCPFGTARCSDGSCRTDCSKRDRTKEVKCSDGLIACPMIGSGVTCVQKLEHCPVGMRCPRDKPVRCLDASCAYSIKDCPKHRTYAISSRKVACASGEWLDFVNCKPVSSCIHKELPFQCWDQSCRRVAEDCPPFPTCPSSKPFMCAGGECISSLDKCKPTVLGCSPETPFKCSSGNKKGQYCAKSRADCPSFTDF